MFDPISAVGLAIVIGLTEVAKKTLPDNLKRLTPLLALAFGLGVATLLPELLTLKEVVLTGLVLGLSASGLYSGTKSIVGK